MTKPQPVMKVDAAGNKWWRLNGKHHREDGPAIEWSDGTEWWFLNGKQLTEEEHSRAMKGASTVTARAQHVWDTAFATYISVQYAKHLGNTDEDVVRAVEVATFAVEALREYEED